jgi:flagellin-like protein
MSERTAIENVRLNRRRRLGRRALGRKQKQAVSPVVATLILILVAVAAAAALYLWLNGWQTGITSSIGSPGPAATVTIGGSTSVFPFDSAAVAQFEQNNTNIVVSNNQGGSGAGMLAVCSGQVDIGTASTFETPSGLEASDNCPVTVDITTVAWDAVDIIVPSANTHGLSSMSFDTLTAIYDRASTTTATLVATTIDGSLLSATPLSTLTAGPLTWNEVPACVANAATCGTVTPGADLPETVSTSAAVGPGVACPGDATLICANPAGPAGVSPCGFTVCAGGANNPIQTVSRSDASGTTQTFEARLLGATSATAFASSTATLGFSGCGSNNLLSDCGMTTTLTANGNPAVITTVAGHADSIGYASDGLVRVSGSGVGFVDFNGVGQAACATATLCANGAVAPTTGATGTISYGAQIEESKVLSASQVPYAGVRPFQWVTENTPAGEVEQLFTWVMDPANNINVAADTFEVSVYSI